MEWKKLRRKIQVPAYIQFFISIVFWIAAGLGLYGTLPLAVYVFMGAGDIQTYEYSFERLLSNLTSNVQ